MPLSDGNNLYPQYQELPSACSTAAIYLQQLHLSVHCTVNVPILFLLALLGEKSACNLHA